MEFHENFKDWALGDIPNDQFFHAAIRLSQTSGDLIVSIDAPFRDDPKPATFQTTSQDDIPSELSFQKFVVEEDQLHYPGLHNYEVVEIFIASCFNDESLSENPYLEIQVGPHGHYMVVSFDRQQHWETQNASITLETLPETKIDRQLGRWFSEVSIPSYLLPEPICSFNLSEVTARWNVNFCAINGVGENRKYYSHASFPAAAAPNFHQLDYFVPLILSESKLVRSPLPSRSPPQLLSPFATFSSSSQSPLKTNFVAHNSPSTALSHTTSNSSDSNISNERQIELYMIEAAASIRRGHQGDVLGEKFAKFLTKGEFDVLHGLVMKKKGMSVKKRVLILTSNARLIYFTPKAEYKGSVPWSMLKPLTVVKVSNTQFNVEVFDKSRTYHFTAVSLGADQWIDAINKMGEAQQTYMTASRR